MPRILNSFTRLSTEELTVASVVSHRTIAFLASSFGYVVAVGDRKNH